MRILAKILFIATSAILSTHCATRVNHADLEGLPEAVKAPFDLDPAIYNTKQLAFESVSGNDYLALNVPFQSAHKIDVELMKRLGKTLKDRNESHITVITPPEYQSISSSISMAEIKALAHQMNLQSSKFEVRCIGRGQSRGQETYYLVVVSEDLVRFREAVASHVKGNVSGFNAEHYFPHITLGFTQRDLHEADGVIKDEKSCISWPKGKN